MMEASDSAMKETHGTVKKPYNLVFLMLALFTVIEINLGLAGDIITDDFLSAMVIAGLITLALAKAYLVAAFFMGLRYQKHPWLLTAGVFGIPLFIAIPVVSFPILGAVVYLCGL
ncbi:MAG: cytochrome C oxidase subunit IV family protein [Candidatus Odinarchaeota archaeon]